MGALRNVVIAFLVPLPSLAFYLVFLQGFLSSDPLPIWKWCADHPILLANLLFFINVDIIFWVISLLQKSTWLIDLYWTVIPVMLVHYYASHPYQRSDSKRSRTIVWLTWVWSIRLTHNYFRREGWAWGDREDWRFADLRKKLGGHWWWVSFFAVYVSQQAFLIGICLPMYAVHTSDIQWNTWDNVATFVCAVGIIIAYLADTQLHAFVKRNRIFRDLGVPVVPTLETGLWRYSRHPNYFGEQLWWWGLVIFGCNTGKRWTLIGSLLNSLCLAYSTVLVEERMMSQASRAKKYKLYKETTSVWVPWFKSAPRTENKST
ncbi:Uncharacterized protein EJ110_NYTH16601 [Nymphaea thermarum]|nr:Uncharacterized protein EJ110_NYTH16601 [Nymphaea thermarum]